MRIIIGLLVTLILLTACQSTDDKPSRISLEEYEVENGFELELVASEPSLDAPVAMDFDSKGRLWVVDMPGFMENLQGQGEAKPSGSIKILEDHNQDGAADHTITFLDSLVMPRALKLVYGGLLYVEPPNLWFVEINEDSPGKRILVDSSYAPEGNPEYQPNGLVLNIDNWIYSAKSNFRYQLKNGKWTKEPTSNRGQWGITHDNLGRLYYNHNSQQLLGDYVLPNRLVRNKFYKPQYGINRLLTDDQRVYPLHPTAVNRGYAEGVLDKDSLLINVTAACGPLIYRGGSFPTSYNENAFVCIPEANLIKRNVLSFHGDSTSARQAWQGKEFLASTDEGFRPVNLSNGPDGALYIADMHRGVIQHYAFLSPYLKEKSKDEQLDTLVGFGRILKVKPEGVNDFKMPDFDSISDSTLVSLLENPNGWIRDQAQHQLIYKNRKSAIPELKNLAERTEHPITQVHALYTLKGLNALTFDFLKNVGQMSDARTTAHAIVLMENFVSEENAANAFKVFQNLLDKEDKILDVYLATTLGTWAKTSTEIFAPLIYQLVERYGDNPMIIEALVSGSGKSVEELLPYLEEQPGFTESELQTQWVQNIERQKNNNLTAIYEKNPHKMDNRTNGAKLFRQTCAACHGVDGRGIEGIAPPFVDSEYIAGPVERIGLIVLHGLSGPVTVDGELYDTNQAMPGMAGNESLSNNDISDVIAYVTNAFSRDPKYIAPEKIEQLRDQRPKTGGEFTEQELIEFIKNL